MKNLYILFFSFFAISSSSLGTAFGTIKGQILDKANGETLIGVPVIISGTTIGTATDIDGKFEIPVAPGVYDLVINYIGYNKKIIQQVKVATSEETTINLTLEATTQQLNEVTITADLRKESIGSILLMQKKSATVQDGISSESIKKTPDKNTSDVIKRVSGASVQEGRFVVVRGLQDRYNLAMLNGVMLPSTEPDRKAFSFDLLPSTLLDNLFIVKTASPDMPAEFAGGIIQINTKEIPETKFFNIGISSSYNDYTTFQSFSRTAGGKTDFIGIDDGTRALPADFATTEDYQRANQATKFELSKKVDNDWAINSNNNAPLLPNGQISFGTKTKLFKKEFGFIGGLTYNRNFRRQTVERADFDFDAATRFKYFDEQFNINTLAGSMLNFSIKLNEFNKISLKNSASINAEDQTIQRSGKDIELQQDKIASASQFTSNQLINSQLVGEHFLQKNKVKIKWFTGAAFIKRSIPNLRRMQYYRNFEINDPADTLYQAYVPFGSASPNFAGKFYSTNYEIIENSGIDLSIPIKFFKQPTIVSIGYNHQFKNRSFDARVLGYVIPNAAAFNYNLLYSSLDTLFQQNHIGPKGFRLDDITNPSDAYTASSQLNAAYAMLDQTIKKFRVVYGIRFENFNQKLNSLGYSNDTIKIDKTYLTALPSINITFAASEKSNLRLAASKTIARPEFRELAPFAFYDFNNAMAIQGNENLTITNITNIDLRFESYPSPGQMMSASVFFKDFKNPIEPIVEGSGAGSRSVTFANAKGATNIGIEAEFRKNFDFLHNISSWRHWEHIWIFGNAALIQSEVDKSDDKRSDGNRPMQGQSPYIINGGIQYNEPKSGFGINVVYNRIGRRIFQVGFDAYKSIYEAPRNMIDIQLSKNVTKHGEIKFAINDLLKNPHIFYQDQNENGSFDKDFDSKISGITVGTNFSFAFNYRF
ncbi:MAG: hypothetical protein RIQ89_2348 [Bacteroidota bacterium]|jgi:outer membrane receptor protein involved in Fe transport